MTQEKQNWLESANEAMDIVFEEVDNANAKILEVGGKEMSNGDKDVGRQAIAFSDRLDELKKRLWEIGEEMHLLADEILSKQPAVRGIIQTVGPITRPIGGTRTVIHVSPWTNFVASFPNGKIIHCSTAKEAFAKVLERFGMDKVSTYRFKFQINGEPLVTQNKNELAKYPASIQPIRGGWFVNTYCGTEKKVEILQSLSRLIGVHVDLQICPHESHQGEGYGRPPKPTNPPRTNPKFPYKPGVLARTMFQYLFRRGMNEISEEEFLMMLDAKRSTETFHTGGNRVLIRKPKSPNDKSLFSSGNRRFYTNFSLTIHDEEYYLTSQWFPGTVKTQLAFYNKHGFDEDSVITIMKSAGVKPNNE